MAKAKATKSKKGAALKGVSGDVGRELGRMASEGARVQVVGSFKNGKLQLDHKALAELEEKWPNANVAFIAANAPFDPTPYVEEA